MVRRCHSVWYFGLDGSKKKEKTMAFTQQVKTIKEAFNNIPDLQDGFKTVKLHLLDMNEAAERQHRRGKPNSLPTPRLTVKDAAKLFTVSHLLDGFAQPDRFQVEDIISIRNEALYAQAYAKRFHKELEPWAAKWAEPFKQVDYVELMKEGR
jgi:hypothetical protein